MFWLRAVVGWRELFRNGYVRAGGLIMLISQGHEHSPPWYYYGSKLVDAKLGRIDGVQGRIDSHSGGGDFLICCHRNGSLRTSLLSSYCAEASPRDLCLPLIVIVSPHSSLFLHFWHNMTAAVSAIPFRQFHARSSGHSLLLLACFFDTATSGLKSSPQ